MDYQSLLELVRQRRTIRKFKPEPIPDEYIDKMIEVARWAPSGANSQPWEFVVVRRQETRDRICELVREQNELSGRMEVVREPEMRFDLHWPPGYAAAPVFIIVCGDTRTKEAYPLSGTLERGRSIFDSSMASAFLYLALAATTLGLGAQWVTAVASPYVQSLTKNLLGIPRDLEIYNMLAVGYPDIEPRPRLVRASEEMIHYDSYDQAKYRTEQDIREFIIKIRARKGRLA